MTEKRRPTARQILDAIVQAMHAAREPLDEGLVLLPPVFDVLLHPEAYQDLQALLPRIKTQAKQRLDAELARLNQPPARFGPVHRLVQRLLRFFSAQHYLSGPTPGQATYERAGEAWSIEFGVTADPDADVDYLAVETDFAPQGGPVLKGRPTINIRRRTLVFPDGTMETTVTAARPGPPGAPARGRRTTRLLPLPPPVTPANALARLTYEDDTGRHVVYMTRPHLCIGRYDHDNDVDVMLHTLPDVSREHVLLRYDETTRRFMLKDVSRFGVTVDGEKVHPGEKRDPNTGWHPLPDNAEIGLANAVFITFEAL
ncbi:MAG: hypothetical protein KatS3mg042_0833 [Rhodothermaceae bacterium]|nr:MAG: hypothetical protein KatS3mg042_0833 [Rhodothermaceae bacterium]